MHKRQRGCRSDHQSFDIAARSGARTWPTLDVQKITDELAIRSLLDEYCLRLEVNRFEEWLDLFTFDTVYHVFGRNLTGHEEVAAMLSLAPHGVHIPGAARIDLDGDTAETLQNYMFVPNSDDRWNTGWYARTLVRTGEGWKIAEPGSRSRGPANLRRMRKRMLCRFR